MKTDQLGTTTKGTPIELQVYYINFLCLFPVFGDSILEEGKGRQEKGRETEIRWEVMEKWEGEVRAETERRVEERRTIKGRWER